MASELKVDTIKHTNNTSAITLDTSGNVTLAGSANNLGTVSAGTFNGTIGSATFPSGIITNAKILTNGTRTSVSLAASTDRELLAFGNYNKLNSNTKIVIEIFCPAHNFDVSGSTGVGIKYGSGSTVWGGSYFYTAYTYNGFLISYFYSDSHTTTGDQAVSLRSGSANGTSTRPCGVLNPTSTDDARQQTTRSTAIIYEIM
tara:strand:+ start:1460 stop:2062 length:603 start_codon:yes stop_codon:yes gene_type:complete